MYALACCDDEGKCFAFLGKDAATLETDPIRLTEENLITFKKKADSNELCMQINLGHSLLPNGRSYRVCPVKM